MNEKELLNLFLDTFPDSTHPKDRGRFISYAIECARNSHYIDIKAMSEKGLDQERIESWKSPLNGLETPWIIY